MKAPKKIYLEWYHVGDKKYRDWVITPKTNNEPVEYIRTDDFVEKACEWLRNNSCNYANNAIGKEHFINDFKVSMNAE